MKTTAFMNQTELNNLEIEMNQKMWNELEIAYKILYKHNIICVELLARQIELEKRNKQLIDEKQK